MRKMILVDIAVVLALVMGMTGCEPKKTPDKAPEGGKTAGQATGDAAKATGTAVKDAATATGEAVGDAAKATGNAVGDAAKATGTAVTDAAKATGDFVTQSKDSAVKSAEETLAVIEKKWAELQAKAAPATDEAKVDFQKAKDMMIQALSDGKAKATEANAAGVGAWNDKVKPSLDAALAKAQKLYDDAAAKFGSK